MWLRQPFGRLYDLISREYGWTDEQIGQLTLDRAAQVRRLIFARLAEERRTHLLDLSNQVATVCSYVAAAQGWKAGAREAGRISFLPPELRDAGGGRGQRGGRRVLPRTKDLLRLFTGGSS